MPLLVLVHSGEDGLVDAEAHGGRDQGQREVADHTGNKQYSVAAFERYLPITGVWHPCFREFMKGCQQDQIYNGEIWPHTNSNLNLL